MKAIAVFILASYLFSSSSYCAPIIVRVASSSIKRPYIINFKNKTGITFDLLRLFNEKQKKYTFTLSIIPPRRLEHIISTNNTYEHAPDVIPFTYFGWANKKFKKAYFSTYPYLLTGEKFISYKGVPEGRKIFSKIGKVKTALINGYDYKFVNYEKNEKILKNKYNVTLLRDEEAVVRFIKHKRAKIGVVSIEKLAYLRVYKPSLYQHILVSKKFDTTFNRVFAIKKNGAISLEEFESLWDKYKRSKRFKNIFNKYKLIHYYE